MISILFSIFIFYFNFSHKIDFSTWQPLAFNFSQKITEGARLASVDFKTVFLGREADAVIGGMYQVRNNNELAKLPISLPHFPQKAVSYKDFSTNASSGVAIDNKNQDILFNKDADKLWSIASITKLVSALVFLDHNPGWDKVYEVKKQDRREGGKIYLFSGEKVKVKDLFYSSLVASGNTETIALANSTGMNEAQFVAAMNEKVKSLGLEKTVFSDPVGLSDQNVSTAKEIAKIAQVALANKDIFQTTLTKKYEFKTLEGKKKKVISTDELLGMDMPGGIKLMGGKTGHTDKAGYCFVGKFVNKNGNEVTSVVLGMPSDDARFSETNSLIDWVFKNYHWQ